MFLLPQIRSLNQPKPMITSTAIIIITKTTITMKTSTTTVKTRTMTTITTKIKRTIIAVMKRQFTTKSYKHNWRKFEYKNIQIF